MQSNVNRSLVEFPNYQGKYRELIELFVSLVMDLGRLANDLADLVFDFPELANRETQKSFKEFFPN